MNISESEYEWLERWFRNFPRNLDAAFTWENNEAFHNLTDDERIALVSAVYRAAFAGSINSTARDVFRVASGPDEPILRVLQETVSLVFSSEPYDATEHFLDEILSERVGENLSERVDENLSERENYRKNQLAIRYEGYREDILLIRQKHSRAFAMLVNPYANYRKHNDIKAWLKSKTKFVVKWCWENKDRKTTQAELARALEEERREDSEALRKKTGKRSVIWGARYISNTIKHVPEIAGMLHTTKKYSRMIGRKISEVNSA